MKYYIPFSFLVAAVLAQDAGPMEVKPFDELSDVIKPYVQPLVTVNESTIALDAAILSFPGAEPIADLIGASTSLLQVIKDGTTAVNPLPQLTDDLIDSILDLAVYVVNLGYFVNQTIFDLVSEKQVFVDECVGPTVLDQIEQQNSAAGDLESALLAKVPTDLLDIASGLAATITDALNSGVSAFADQSTIPSSCSVTTTTTTTTITTTTATPTGSTTMPSTATSTSIETATTSVTATTQTVTGDPYLTGTTSTLPEHSTSCPESSPSSELPGYPTGSLSGYSNIIPPAPSTTSTTSPSSSEDCEETSLTSSTSSTSGGWEGWVATSSSQSGFAGHSYTTQSTLQSVPHGSALSWSAITYELSTSSIIPSYSISSKLTYAMGTTTNEASHYPAPTTKFAVYTTTKYAAYTGMAAGNNGNGIVAAAVAAVAAAALLQMFCQ